MVRLPWRRNSDGGVEEPPGGLDVEPLLTCSFQDGTLHVYEDHVFIERAGPSRFAEKTIPRDEITDVAYAKGLAIGYLQVEQTGFENDSAGFLSSPVDENTLHFGRGARDCAERARDELLFGET